VVRIPTGLAGGNQCFGRGDDSDGNTIIIVIIVIVVDEKKKIKMLANNHNNNQNKKEDRHIMLFYGDSFTEAMRGTLYGRPGLRWKGLADVVQDVFSSSGTTTTRRSSRRPCFWAF
jgi:hypothetical protein